MPTAQKFISDGGGNGFPFCPSTWEISGFDKWTTLSGWSHDNEPTGVAAKDSSIQLSLIHAMSIFWNLHSVHFDSTSSSGGSIGTAVVGFQKSQSQPFPDPPIIVDSGEFIPKDRICFGSTGDDFDLLRFVCGVSSGTSSSVSSGDCNSPSSIVRMLKNGEFIGYGLSPAGTGTSAIPSSVFYTLAAAGNPPTCSVGLSGAISNIVGNASAVADSAISNTLGFYGIGAAFARSGGIATGSVDPSNLSAASSTASDSVSSQISSVGFYTY